MTATDIVQLPYNYDLKIKQGADRNLGISLEDANGVPQNLTGYTSKLTVRAHYGGPVLLELTSSDDIAIGGALGTVDVAFKHTKTAALAFESAIYDWYIKSAAAIPTYTYLLEGSFTVTPQVAL